MTKEEVVRACSYIIEELPAYDIAEPLMESAIKHAIGDIRWDALSSEDRLLYKKETYAGLKQAFSVKDIDDKFTREDIHLLKVGVKRNIHLILNKVVGGSAIGNLAQEALNNINKVLGE